MNVWLVKRTDDKFQYDEFDAFVVRADNEEDARRVASSRCADEGPDIWFEETTTVQPIQHVPGNFLLDRDWETKASNSSY